MNGKKLSFLVPLFFIVIIAGCSLFESFEEEGISISSLRLSASSLRLKEGNMEHISVTVTPSEVQKDISPEWSYDDTIIDVTQENSYGITFTGIKAGQTNLSCSYGGISASCIVTVTAADTPVNTDTPAPVQAPEKQGTDPYIYSNTTILQMVPGGREKVFVSLYGGNAGDVDGYTWTIEDNTVATIQPTGQYCIIEAKGAGYSRIKIMHSKAAYPYYIGVYVFQENVNTYITTGDNIITMNLTDKDKNVGVSLVNALPTSNDNSFSWEIMKEDDSSEVPIRLESVANNAVIHPLSGGSCTVRVSHPDAPYPLDILCRIIVVVRNVYIETDKTILEINDGAEYVITSSLRGVDGTYSDADFSYSLDDTAVAEIVSEISNKVVIKAKANGFCKLTVSHPMAEYQREVLINVKGQATTANTQSRSFSLSTNYIRTKIGAQTTNVQASLSGGGGEDYFEWSVTHKSAGGTGADVINMLATRNYAYIEPATEGTAVITVRHPQSASEQEIFVKVLPANAVMEEPLYFSGTGIIKVLNGGSFEYTVTLSGKEKTAADDKNIVWSIEDTRYSLSPNDATCIVHAPAVGTGTTRTTLTISNDRSEHDKTVSVISADDQETLDSIKMLVTGKSWYNLCIGDEDVIGFEAEGFGADEFDYRLIQWRVSEPAKLIIEPIESSALCRIRALKSGSYTVTASYGSCSCTFNIYVYPEGVMATEPEAYFTANNNYISIYNINDSATAYVHAINLAGSKCGDIQWFTDDTQVVSLVPNGTECTIRGISPGNAEIYVSHPDCINRIKFFVSVCGQSLPVDDLLNSESLSCQQNYVRTKCGVADSIITVNLHNLGAGEENRLVWSISENPETQGNSVISAVTPTGTITSDFQPDSSPVTNRKTLQYGKIAVRPLNPGTASITVRHPQAKNFVTITVTVLDAGAILEESLYFSGKNIITFTNDKTYFYSVTLNGINKEPGDESSICWLCDCDSFTLLATGQDAMLMSNTGGRNVGRLTISHPKVQYPKSVLVISADTQEELDELKLIYMPSTSYNVTAGESFDIPLRFYGWDSVDDDRVVWRSSSPDVASVRSGTVTGVKAGTAEITASYLGSSASAKVFVYPAGTEVSNDPTESQGSDGTPENGGIRITVLPGDIVLDSTRSGKSVSFSVRNNVYDSYTWIFDDEDMNETSSRLTIDTDGLAEGSYDLTLFAMKDGMCWSASVQIQIR